jgi:hypothetical protein
MVSIARVQAKRKSVMPAKAGRESSVVVEGQWRKTWIPACAGKTDNKSHFESTFSQEEDHA